MPNPIDRHRDNHVPSYPVVLPPPGWHTWARLTPLYLLPFGAGAGRVDNFLTAAKLPKSAPPSSRAGLSTRGWPKDAFSAIDFLSDPACALENASQYAYLATTVTFKDFTDEARRNRTPRTQSAESTQSTQGSSSRGIPRGKRNRKSRAALLQQEEEEEAAVEAPLDDSSGAKVEANSPPVHTTPPPSFLPSPGATYALDAENVAMLSVFIDYPLSCNPATTAGVG